MRGVDVPGTKVGGLMDMYAFKKIVKEYLDSCESAGTIFEMRETMVQIIDGETYQARMFLKMVDECL